MTSRPDSGSNSAQYIACQTADWFAVRGSRTGIGSGVTGDSAKGVGVCGETSAEGRQGVFGRAKGAS